MMETMFWTAAFLAMTSLLSFSLRSEIMSFYPLVPLTCVSPLLISWVCLQPLGDSHPTAEYTLPSHSMELSWGCTGVSPARTILLNSYGPSLTIRESKFMWWWSWLVHGSGPKSLLLSRWLLQLCSHVAPLLHRTPSHSNLRQSLLISTECSLHFSLRFNVQSLSESLALGCFRHQSCSTAHYPWGSLPLWICISVSIKWESRLLCLYRVIVKMKWVYVHKAFRAVSGMQ